MGRMEENKIMDGMLNLFQQYLNNNRIKEKPILIPITRKGFWVFRILYDQREKYDKNHVLEQYEIYSDRYLTKVLDNKEFKGRRVLLFDDILVTGDNLFYYFALLTKWEAEVTPITLERKIDSEEGGKGYDDNVKREFYEEIFLNNKKMKMENEKRYQEVLSLFWKRQDPYQDFQYWVTEDEIVGDSLLEISLLEKQLCPMVIDLPIIRDKYESNGRYTVFSLEEWEKIQCQNSEWIFVENYSAEIWDSRVNASFFEAVECMQQLSLWGVIENCIIKCKYQIVVDHVNVVFVPFVIMKSMSYYEVDEMFLHLFGDTEYGNSIKQFAESQWELNNADSLKQKLLVLMKGNTNFYRAAYRAIILYFSAFIGGEFIEFIDECGIYKGLDYDWEFMNHHMPKELIHTIKELMGNRSLMTKKMMISYSEKMLDVNSCLGDGNVEKERWEKAYYNVKQIFTNLKFTKSLNDSYKNMVTIEMLENEIASLIPDMNKTERRIIITKLITLFQETSSFSNYILNDQESGTVRRGFKPGENTIKLFRKDAELFVPYIYALYLKIGSDNFYDEYRLLISRMESYFYHEGYFEYKISRYAFEFYAQYFEDNSLSGWSIEDKLLQVRYIIGDYLKGDNRDYDNVFQLVYDWEL